MICERETLYPKFGVETLRRLRGAIWTELVDHVVTLPATHPDVMAFTLMIRHLRHDLGLNNHTHCQKPGCALCATQVLVYYDGSDEELLERYDGSLNQINVVFEHLQVRPQPASWAVA